MCLREVEVGLHSDWFAVIFQGGKGSCERDEAQGEENWVEVHVD